MLCFAFLAILLNTLAKVVNKLFDVLLCLCNTLLELILMCFKRSLFMIQNVQIFILTIEFSVTPEIFRIFAIDSMFVFIFIKRDLMGMMPILRVLSILMIQDVEIFILAEAFAITDEVFRIISISIMVLYGPKN